MKDPKTRKSAKGWVGFIKDTAQRKNVCNLSLLLSVNKKPAI